MNTFKKILWAVLALLVIGGSTFCYFRYWFPYAEGTDSGQLNFFSRQGVVFKTYEGKLIQTGFKSPKTSGSTIQSNEFVFSVEDEHIADILMHNTGKEMELHYKRYFAPLPWRGQSVYVVDSIWSVANEMVAE